MDYFDNKHIIKIESGAYHVLLLDSNGNLYTISMKDGTACIYGQLGCGPIDDNIQQKSGKGHEMIIKWFIDNNIKIMDIACGWIHNLAVDYNGNIYGWGYNKSGQCGDGSTDNLFFPKKINIRFDDDDADLKIIEVKCGIHHSLAKSENGKYFMWGIIVKYPKNVWCLMGRIKYYNHAVLMMLSRICKVRLRIFIWVIDIA